MPEKEYWGADIGGSAVKAVKLRRVNGKLELAAADVVPLKGEPASEVSYGRDRRIWIALNQLARRNNIRHEPLVISVPARATFVRPFDVLVVGDKPTEELVRFEVQQHIPFGLDTVIWDYDLFAPPQGQTKREGVMFALKKEVLNNYLMSMSAAQLQADDIQPAPLALYNFVRYDQQVEEPALILDIGATCTDMVMMHDGRYTVGSVPVGGQGLTRVLQERFQLSAERAEQAKRHVGKLRLAKDVLEALLPAMRKYVGEVQNAVRRMRTEVGEARPRKVLLFGGAASTVGLVKMLAGALECEVEVPQSFKRIELNPDVDPALIASQFSELGVAVGLALKGAGEADARISLISTTAFRRKIASRSLPFVAVTLAVAALAVGWLGAFGSFRAGRLTARRMELERSLKPVDDVMREWAALSSPSEAQRSLDQYAKLDQYHGGWSQVMSRLSSILPLANRTSSRETDKLWLVRLTLERKDNTIQAVSWWAIRSRATQSEDDDFARSSVIKRLAEMPGFSNVLMSVQLPKGGTQGQRYVNEPTEGSPVAKNGVYMLFPVTFEVDLATLEKGK